LRRLLVVLISALVLVGCGFKPDIEPLVFPTVPPQPFSQFAPSAEPTFAPFVSTPGVQPSFEGVDIGESPQRPWVPWAVAGGGALAAGLAALGLWRARAAKLRARLSRDASPRAFTFRPWITRLAWAVPLAASAVFFSLALANCPGTKTCTVVSPTGMLVQVACEDEAQAQAEATETKTPLPPGHPGGGDTPTPGGGEISGDWPVNSRGEPYPVVNDPRTGRPIPPPPKGLAKVPEDQRVSWDGSSDRDRFIREWHERGFSEPEGGWSKYDIHHSIPREYGGTNDFDNLVPVLRGDHQDLFNRWWTGYVPGP